MKLVTYRYLGNELPGVLSSDEKSVISFSSMCIGYSSINELIIANDRAALEKLQTVAAATSHPYALPLESISLMAPIPFPMQDVICLGINYAAHAEEAERFHNDAFGKRLDTIYFSKRVSRAASPNETIPSYKNLVDSLDYESELAVILSRDAFKVSADHAGDYIFGYTIINDISARNVQTTHKQWYLGKSMDGFTPMGPCIISADEVSFPPKLGIRSYVNGELRQNSNTGLLISGIPEIIEDLSSCMTLKAGTIISTGTPAGVGMGFVPPRFLNSGDTVTCEIEKIGRLTNTIGE